MIAELAAHACFKLAGRASRRDDPLTASRWLLASLASAPSAAIAWLNLGNELRELGRVETALGCYRQALALAPNDPNCQFSVGVALLTLGEFREGWKFYEARYAMPDFRERNGLRGGDVNKMWTTSLADLTDKRLLVFAEQGLGDSIMALRYIRWLSLFAREVVLRVPGQLFRLCRSSFAELDNLRVISDGDRLGEYDLFAPLMSLPARTAHVFEPALQHSRGGYLDVWPDERHTLSPLADSFRVGVVWSGGDHPKHRNIPLSVFSRMFDVSWVEWVSLQAGKHASEAGLYPQLRVVNLTDFYETARVMKTLDLVISVDTSSAHLAGALGVPVWNLIRFNADFRWLRDRTDTPWYSKMLLFRQPRPGDWASVISSVYRALRVVANRHAPPIPESA